VGARFRAPGRGGARAPRPGRQSPDTSRSHLADAVWLLPSPCLWSAQAAAAQRRTHSLVESLWNRPHVFSARVAELRELLEATLVWKPGRFLQLWLKMLPVEPAYAEVDFFQCTHGKGHENTEWGYETTPVWRLNRRGTKPQPAIVPRSEAEGRRKHAGESQHALRIWFFACGTRWSPCCAARTK